MLGIADVECVLGCARTTGTKLVWSRTEMSGFDCLVISMNGARSYHTVKMACLRELPVDAQLCSNTLLPPSPGCTVPMQLNPCLVPPTWGFLVYWKVISSALDDLPPHHPQESIRPPVRAESVIWILRTRTSCDKTSGFESFPIDCVFAEA
ncbi:hypothetical protein ARMSODRAFT_603846 [Armillaria solidipes]|uniref:Uncharacterized protein n=1 Tax=Armillaria solidipes TaxID=1076256 RepID=A0A2H3AYH9_9AGAR|nr:hypothetical protein ARMSODRAFT_603846 [Armillaria solidipes]